MPQPDAHMDDSVGPPTAGRLAAAWKISLQRIPRKVRLAVLTASVVLFGLALYTFLFSSSATLNLVCHHNLRSAELSVFIDGKLADVEQISGAAKKRFGIFDTRIEGSFSKSLAVAAGHHVVRLRLRSAADGFDQTKVCGVNLVPGEDSSVVVTTGRGTMSLAYEGPRVETENETLSSYFNSLRTVLVTILGSAVSAAIAFIVQEALRAKKSALPLHKQNS